MKDITKYTNCQICDTKLAGKRTKFCSRQCLNKSVNVRHKTYELQQERGHSRKAQLVEMFGGCCELCKYNKCLASLSFHHKNPSEKKFGLDVRCLSNRKWEIILEEVSKCRLLCLNCHTELHFLENNPVVPVGLEPTTSEL